uniref:Small ribosomal subunit protein mS33 n=1 Tax=Amphora coffeiformis TaxID=265554 RepID=A0A7S3LDV7_9STRA|mmetsp:Transcript_11666/g.22355  ORF Transcript_11666/g.22355 Transcript_11666/m.22355 type:complete len:108 (-) Transcript_11666:117-440(-)
MSSQRGAKKLLEMYPQLKQGIAMARRDILGHIPKTSNNARTGYNRSTKQLTGVYLNQYYQEPIDKYVRMVEPGFLFDQEERRRVKLIQLRRRGKGPPKKGSGKRKKK